jgi:hypothetical protein
VFVTQSGDHRGNFGSCRADQRAGRGSSNQ